MSLRKRLASDHSFKNLVRTIVAYIDDPNRWDAEVDKVVGQIVPRQHLRSFKEAILRKIPGIENVSEYFTQARPRNRANLEQMVKNVYSALYKPQVETEQVAKVPQWIQDLKKEYKDYSISTGPVRDIFKEVRQESGRSALPRTASKVVLAYLDSIK